MFKYLYFVLFILLQLAINCQTKSFKPSHRYLHTTTLIDNKLYILGGHQNFNSTINAGKEFFYLDVSISFDTQNLLWYDLTNINIIPTHAFATTVRGANNDTLIVYGGRNLTNAETMAQIYVFDSQSNSWYIPSTTGVNYVKRRGLTAKIDNNGKIYLFGGWIIGSNYVNEMLILDTINLTWREGSSQDAPVPRINYGAVLLPNQNIIYLGGMMHANRISPLNEVYSYDTIHDKWSTIVSQNTFSLSQTPFLIRILLTCDNYFIQLKKTSGSIPSDRFGFSAVLGLDNQRIIIFGGNETSEISSLYSLDVNEFKWYVPKVYGILPTSRYYVEHDILLLDISNDDEYKWTTEFNPSYLSSPPTPMRKSTNIPTLVGTIIASLSGGSFFTIGMLYLYRWIENRRRNKVAVLEVPGSYVRE
ncbi:8283_t:CDS:2 [Funneliformis caledonium]|uniref:8283_t:CDS:1 n=1 Tax=Funneliformis caledonium TaxID=1117310 RepID=A0A9N8ZQ63_9GLOM|nr:8283_t:CDS:2 [Funneliformis caledonium]